MKAMDRLRADLRKRSQPAPEEVPQKQVVEPTEKTIGSSEKPEGAEAPVAPAPAPEGDKKKVNPWKLVDEYKGRLANVEKELADSKTTGLAQQEKQALEQRATQAETRLKELEDELRFIDFSKSAEFKTKYQQPYEAAWKRAMSELSEIGVQDETTGDTRAANAQDMLELVNLPLGKARERAQALFGDFADDAMAHRKEIRHLFDEQQAALDDAKKSGAEREKQRHEQVTKTVSEMQQHIAKAWSEANQEATKDEKFGKYFTPQEGNEEVNKRLEKGFALADRAFSENPLKPGLKAEERQAIVRRHAAVRNRCAAFGSLVYQLNQAQSKITELTKELSQFKASEPGGGEGLPGAAPGQPAKAMDRLTAELRKRAIPL